MHKSALSLILIIVCMAASHAAAATADSPVMRLLLITWKPTATADEQRAASAKLVALKDSIPGIISITVGNEKDAKAGQTGASRDGAIFLVFSNKAALEGYLASPLHESVKNQDLFPLIASINRVADYEVK